MSLYFPSVSHLNRNSTKKTIGTQPFSSVPGLYEELPPESSQENPHWGEALRVLMGRLQLEVCQV